MKVNFESTTHKGHRGKIVFQVADVNQALGSSSYLADHGYKVIFEEDAITGRDLSRMEIKSSGKVTRFRRDRNGRILDAIIEPPVVGRPA